MSEAGPLIQNIRDRFEEEARRPAIADPTVTSGVAIESTLDSYKITAYPQREYGYEGFVFEAGAPEGIFGSLNPTYIKTSFDSAGVFAFEGTSDKETAVEYGAGDSGMVSQTIRVLPTVTSEDLILPGDPGFELFEQLQSRLAALKEPVIGAVATVGMVIDPKTLSLYETKKHGTSYDRDPVTNKATVTRNRKTALSIGSGDGARLEVRLDASVRYPEEDLQSGKMILEEDPLMVYTEGSAWTRRMGEQSVSLPPLEADTLVAFSGLYAVIRTLYR